MYRNVRIDQPRRSLLRVSRLYQCIMQQQILLNN